MNNGGNSAPMMSGIGPLFQLSILGFGVDRDGHYLEPVRLKDGVLTNEDGDKMVTIRNACAENKSLPIAVLIGPSTVSSAEILAAYLKQQGNVRLFGQPTPGYCNVTEGFVFMNSQGYLLLSVNKIADAKKHVYEEMLVRPDIYIKGEENFEKLEIDPAVKASLKWLTIKAKRKR